MNRDSPRRYSYRLDLQYVGTSFVGWQSQPGGNTVQDCVSDAISTFVGAPTTVVGASRTDSGVHAKHQVCTFSTELEVDTLKILPSLLALLPESIGIKKIQRVGDDFNPISAALGKVYCYRFWTSRERDPFWEPFVARVYGVKYLGHMEDAAKDFVGSHDFTSFCAQDSSAKTFVRNIFDVRIKQDGNMGEIWISGGGFLKQMVRIMVGTLFEIGQGKRSKDCLPGIFSGRDRILAGPTAPAKGLSLERIYYEDDPRLPPFPFHRR